MKKKSDVAAFTYDAFWDTVEDGYNLGLEEPKVVVGLMVNAIGFMKETGMSESELLEQVRSKYRDWELDSKTSIDNLKN